MAKKSKRWTSLPSTTKVIGGQKLPIPLEEDMQKSVIAWADWEVYKSKPLSMYIHHSPNGGFRHYLEALKFKLMGVRAGYPDLIIDIAKGGYHGMRIELKRSKSEKSTPNQDLVMNLLREEGYYVVVCKGYEEARQQISGYVKGTFIRQPE